jgi:hypothetical protein
LVTALASDSISKLEILEEGFHRSPLNSAAEDLIALGEYFMRFHFGPIHSFVPLQEQTLHLFSFKY